MIREGMTKTVLMAVAAAVTMTGCMSMQEITRDVNQANDSALQRAEGALAPRQHTAVRGPIITDAPYVDTRPVPVQPRFPLIFQREVTFAEPVGVPIQVLAQRIEQLTGMRVTYQSELVSEAAQQVSATAQVLPDLPPLGQAVSALQLGGVQSTDIRAGVALNYRGTVRGLLDAVAGATGSSWKYDEVSNRVDFFRYTTEIFRIAAPVGSGSSGAGIGQSGGSSQGLSTATAQREHQTEGSVWEDVENTIKSLISPEGRYALSKNLGTVVVRDRQDRMEMIKDFIDRQNAALARGIDFDIAIYRVQVRRNDARAVNWSAFIRSYIENSRWSAVFDTTALAPQTPGQDLSQTVIRINENYNGAPQRWGGSEMMIEALNQLGNASLVNNLSAQTVNNRPAPVRVTHKVGYLAETTQGVAGGGANAIATGAQLTPGEVETGLVMYLLPHVQDDGKRILLEGMISLSTLERLDTVSSGDLSIQVPQVAAREFQQTAWLNSGETLVLAGFEQVDAGFDSAGPFDARMWGLGGRREARKDRELVVVTITPSVRSARSGI